MEVVNLTHMNEQIYMEPHVMAIGFFDGVHLGHQKLLNHAKDLARKNNVQFTAMTFSPHPDEVIKKDTDRKYLMPLPQKIKRMESMGVDKLFVIKFDRDFASLPPADFIQSYITGMNTRHVVVGFDFTFGFKAQGNTEYLRRKSKELRFGLTVIPKKTYMGEKISSTLIRELIQNGEIDVVPYYLGSNYEVNVHILQHNINKRAVIKPIGNFMLPSPGSYLVEVIHGAKKIHGEFHQYSNTLQDNELVINESIRDLKETCSLVFLDKISSEQSVSV